MRVRLYLFRLLAIIAIAGMAMSPVAAPPTSSAQMSIMSDMAMDDMSCCPSGQPMVPDCQKACPSATFCFAKCVRDTPSVVQIISPPVRVATVLRDDPTRDALSRRPPPRPPRA